MSFILIKKGKFFAAGYLPDGDSVKLKAGNQNNWEKIEGRPKLSKIKKQVQLHFGGVK